ncbi:MAG: sensor histidine kinase, partial [Eubacteriales bacterium]|nr:sensor histidine kinase [Eubacteriales bacterium]
INNMELSGSAVRFFSNNPNVITGNIVYTINEAKDQSWFEGAQEATYLEPVWDVFHEPRNFQLINSRSRGSLQMSVYVPIVGCGALEDRGTLVEVYADVNDAFDMLFADTDQNGMVMLLDGMGQVRMSNTANQETLKDFLVTNDWRSGTNQMQKIGDRYYYMTYRPLDRLHATMVMLYPADDVQAKKRRTGAACFGAALAGLALMAGLSILLSKTLVRKIDGLLDVMRKVQRGDLDVEAQVSGGDEIDELALDFNLMIGRIRELIDTVYKFSILQKDALFKSLQSQINPHFLYNTIETIRMMAEAKQERQISDAMEAFGGMMRYNMSAKQEIVRLGHEMEQIDAYCRLNNLMVNDKLTLKIEMDASLTAALIPKLCIQPLVENAIIHGFSKRQDPLTVRVTACRKEDMLEICVADDGVGIEAAYLDTLSAWLEDDNAPPPKVEGNGIGLKNVHQRIRLKYGKEYGMQIESTLGEGTQVYLRLPYATKGMGDIQ